MRRALLIVPLMLIIATASSAQLPPVGYIGLYTDDTHTAWCTTGSMPFYFTDMWILCLPSVNGMLCAEFAISYPATAVITSTVTPNSAIISVQQGDLPNGMSVCYIDCQWDWHWCFHQQLIVNAPDLVFCELIPHSAPQITQLQFAGCIPPTYPIEPAIKHSNFYINYDPVTAPECQVTSAESKSWGAIKNLVTE